MTDRFGPDDLQLLRETREVVIETRSAADGLLHRTVIWVVVDDEDRVLIRTYLGPRSRWYREVLAQPDCRLQAGGRMLEVRAVPAGDDPDRVAAYDAAVQRKYARSKSTPFMLQAHVLPTTLELRPG